VDGGDFGMRALGENEVGMQRPRWLDDVDGKLGAAGDMLVRAVVDERLAEGRPGDDGLLVHGVSCTIITPILASVARPGRWFRGRTAGAGSVRRAGGTRPRRAYR